MELVIFGAFVRLYVYLCSVGCVGLLVRFGRDVSIRIGEAYALKNSHCWAQPKCGG